ncbi:MAG: hypothetical protein Q9183_004988 [Haloplaca sp. 2 TL-2023]
MKLQRISELKPGLSQVRACEIKIGYVFNNPLLLWEALQADGAWTVLAAGDGLPGGHKRLAIVGDRLLELLLVVTWYPTLTHPRVYEGSRKVTTNANLIAIFDRAHLGDFVTRAAGASEVAAAVKSATVEAIIGAVFLDASGGNPGAGIAAATKVAEKLEIAVFKDASEVAALREAQATSD